MRGKGQREREREKKRFQAAQTLFMTNPALLQFLLSEQSTFPTWKEKNSLQEKKKKKRTGA